MHVEGLFFAKNVSKRQICVEFTELCNNELNCILLQKMLEFITATYIAIFFHPFFITLFLIAGQS